jgi:hypothetical protein
MSPSPRIKKGIVKSNEGRVKKREETGSKKRNRKEEKREFNIPKDTNYTQHHPLRSNNPHKTVSSSTNRMSDHHSDPRNASLSPAFSLPRPLSSFLPRLHPAIAMMIDSGAAFLNRYDTMYPSPRLVRIVGRHLCQSRLFIQFSSALLSPRIEYRICNR